MSKIAIGMNLLRAAMLIWVLPLFLIFVGRTPFVGEIGYTMHSSEHGTFVSAGSHPIPLVWSTVALIFFLALMQMNQTEIRDGVPSLGRRCFASLIDFLFVVAALGSFGALVPLWMETKRTGHFAWQFQRDYSVPADNVLLPAVFATMALMLLYFVWPLMKGKQTVGCFIMGIKVTPPFGDSGAFTFRTAVRRVWYEFKGCCSFLRFKDGRDRFGRTWYDQETNCTVISIRYE